MRLDILSKGVLSTAGADWYKSSGGVNLLGEVIRTDRWVLHDRPYGERERRSIHAAGSG
jgi:hypothetical protein